jgi:hypothetical protein
VHFNRISFSPLSLLNPGVLYLFLWYTLPRGRKPMDRSLILYAVWRSSTMNGKIAGIRISPWAFVRSSPQNNVEGLLVSVSEFEPQVAFQGCTCTGFSLDHLKFISQNPQNRFIGSNAESTGHILPNG